MRRWRRFRRLLRYSLWLHKTIKKEHDSWLKKGIAAENAYQAAEAEIQAHQLEKLKKLNQIVVPVLDILNLDSTPLASDPLHG